MHSVLQKTFGGLSVSYYFRQFIFGLAVSGFIYAMLSQGKHPLGLPTILMMVVNTLLYPYSRFVYESVMSFILGQNVFYGNALLFLAMKVTTIAMCWVLAVFVAPFGLTYLYFYHSRSSR